MRKLAAAVLLLVFLPLVAGQATVETVLVEVYESGYVKVTQVVLPSEYSVAVEVPVLGGNITGLSVLDESGDPLLFEVNGSSLTVYALNSTTKIRITYFTASLTSKEGEIWNLSYSFPYPVTVKLPAGAVVVDLSDLPFTITANTITMPPGNQYVSYILPAPTSTPEPTPTTTTTTSDTQSTPTNTTSSSTSSTTSTPQPTSTTPESTTPESPDTSSTAGIKSLLPLIGLIAIVGVSALAYWSKKKTGTGDLPVSRDEFREKLESLGLTEGEISALLYVYDQGGKAKQADIRKALGIPKTTAWRMFKRLEENGLVKVYKRGKENWVELKF